MCGGGTRINKKPQGEHMVQKASKQQTKQERDPVKLAKVLASKGYAGGILPKGKEAHYVKSVAEGGKTTKSNIRVVSSAKHSQIHSNRRKAGKV
jgi:hypothetical protein